MSEVKIDMLSTILTKTCKVISVIHSTSNKSIISFVEQHKDILTEASRIAGKVGRSRMKKGNTIKGIRRGIIFSKIEVIKHTQLKIKWNKNISDRIVPYHGVNGILTHYHLICYPDIGIGRCSIKIIPCYCIDFRSSMDLPKDQPRYTSVTKWKYYSILVKHNDWVIMYFIDKGTALCSSVELGKWW